MQKNNTIESNDKYKDNPNIESIQDDYIEYKDLPFREKRNFEKKQDDILQSKILENQDALFEKLKNIDSKIDEFTIIDEDTKQENPKNKYKEIGFFVVLILLACGFYFLKGNKKGLENGENQPKN